MLRGHGIQKIVDLLVDRLDPLLQGVYFQRRVFELLVQFRSDLAQKLFVRIFFTQTIFDPLQDMTFETVACEGKVFTDSVAPAPESAAGVRMGFDLFRIRSRGPEIGMSAPGAGDQSRKQIIRSGRPSAELARELTPAFALLLRREPQVFRDDHGINILFREPFRLGVVFDLLLPEPWLFLSLAVPDRMEFTQSPPVPDESPVIDRVHQE